MAIGHTPNTQLFEGLLKMDESGYLITKPDSTATARWNDAKQELIDG